MSATELLPSIREATISNTEKYGPKAPNHITPAELAARAAQEAAKHHPERAAPQTGLLPSMREATIANTEKYGPKVGGNRPSEASASTAHATEAAAVAAATTPTAGSAVTSKSATAAAAVPEVKTAPAAVVAAAPAKTSPQPTASAKLTEAAVAAPRATTAAAPPSSSHPTSLTARVATGVFAVGAAALTVFSIYKGVELYNRYRLRRCVTELEQQQPEVVHLYIHRRSPLAPSISVPCTRLETFLRVSGIPYEAHVLSDPSISPNGRLPFIAFGGEQIGDIPTIMTRLSAAYGVDLDRQLSAQDRATGTAVLAALNYSLTKGYLRAVHVDAVDLIRPYYSEMNQTPDWLTRLALSRMRKDVVNTHVTTGYAKLTVEQYQQELFDDVRAIEGVLLNGTDFLFSNAGPSTYDCALYAWLLPIVAMVEAAEVNDAFEYAVQSEPITAYVKRMTDLAFPDLDALVNEGRPEWSRSRSRSAVMNGEDYYDDKSNDVDGAEDVKARTMTESIALADAAVARAEAEEAVGATVASSRGVDVNIDADTSGAVEESIKMDIPVVDSPIGIHDNEDDAQIDMDAEEV